MGDRPSGTVTFLFTDIEGSTRLWQNQPGAMGRALERHDLLLRSAIEDRGGYVFKTVGDSFCAAFESAIGAVNAALAIQLAINEEEWPEGAALGVRAALHSGEAASRDGDYYGVELSRVGRLLSASHSGQVLVSGATRELVQDHLPENSALRPMGTHRLRDLSRTEDVYQLEHRDLEGEFPALNTLENLPNNLPRQLTSFVGREQDLDDLEQLFKKTSILTLTGVGGTGKTRLALQFAADRLDSFEHGVWLAELAPLSDQGLVPNTVAEALGFKEEQDKTITETLVAKLQDKEILILLDNCEHLLDACAELSEELLRSCKRLKILATSREGLGVKGEHSYRVRSLPSPRAEEATADALKEYDAVRLFTDRAVAARDGFDLTDENAQAVAAVRARLDGIPLAIELAAARMRSMTPQDVNDRLDQKFHLLTGGAKSALKRHQTLQGLIDWSYDLLNEPEKALLKRLAVFRGGCSAEAAESVCSDEALPEPDVINVLASLVDKSLVSSEETGGHSRYRMLETVRDYAIEKLSQEGGTEQWRDRHLAFFMRLSEEAAPMLWGPEQLKSLDLLELEHDNVRAALDWSQTSSERSDDGLRTASAVARFWRVRGHFSEGRARLKTALDSSAGDQVSRANALKGAGNLATYQSDFVGAAIHLKEALDLYRGLGDKRGEAEALNGLGITATYEGELDRAQDLYEQCLTLYNELGNNRSVGLVLGNLGVVAKDAGDFDTALIRQKESLAVNREIGNKEGVAHTLGNLGTLAMTAGEVSDARRYQQESLALFSELGSKTGTAVALVNLGDADCADGDLRAARRNLSECLEMCSDSGDHRVASFALENFVVLSTAEGRPADSARLSGAAEALRERIRSPLPTSSLSEYEKRIAAARKALGDDAAFDAAREEGRAMSFEQAVELAISEVGDE